MKGFLKKSIQSARKSKSLGHPVLDEEPFIRGDTTLVDLTAETAHRKDTSQVDAEVNDASTTQLTTREGVDLGAEASTDRSAIRSRGSPKTTLQSFQRPRRDNLPLLQQR